MKFFRRLCLTVLTVACAGAGFAQDTPSNTPPKLAKLHVVSAQDTSVTRQFFGHVVAKETVDLAFQVSGQVVDIPIVEGNPVAQGAVVAQLDLEPFELALAQAKLQREQAERTFDRLTQLQGSNTVSQVSVDDAQTQMDLARIAERNAERSLEEAQLLSPFAGLVARRYVPNFTTISAGTPIARLHDMSELRVEIDVPEILFQSAGEDPDVDLFAKFPASDSRFPLEVREFNAETSQVGQTFGITLGMPPPTGLVVLPGSSVTVFATLKGGAPSLHIPASAIVPAPDGTPQVMVFAPTGADEGTVTPQPVTVTPDAMGRVTVTSGLEPGQEIVASGAALLQAGDSVRRFTGFAN